MARQKKLLEERYDLTPRPDTKVTMSRGKPIPVGPTAKLPEGMTWDKLAAMSRDEIREQGPVPQGLPAAAAPQARGRRHGLPADGDQAAGRGWSASTSTSTCPSTSCPSSRRPSS